MLNSILESRPVECIQQHISIRDGLPIQTERSAVNDNLLRADLSVGQLAPDLFVAFAEEHCDAIVAFSDDAKTNWPDEDADGFGDPDTDACDRENTIVHGYSYGFGTRWVIYFYLASTGDAKLLRTYLKNRRIPRPGSFARDIERSFRRVNGPATDG